MKQGSHPKRQVENHESDEAETGSRFDGETLNVKEVSNHESTGNVTKRNDKSA